MKNSIQSGLTALGFAVLMAPLAAQDSNVALPQSLLDEVNALLPERSNAGASFLSSAFDPNLEMVGNGTVSVTFVLEGAGYRNTLGYFTYTDNGGGSYTINSSNLIMPNASFPSAGTLASGDTFDLRDASGAVRTFTTGERIGFFLIADGWRTEPTVMSWNPNAVAIPTNAPVNNLFIGRGCFTSIPELNPEVALGQSALSKHVAMIERDGIPGFFGGDKYYLVGFEDLNRAQSSDDDFNDLVFVVTATPESSVTANVENPPSTVADDDNDGLPNADDAFPNDADRAFRTRYPSNGSYTLAFEDRYPEIGDADYNDVVVSYYYDYVTDVNGDIKDIAGTFELKGRGAGFNHGFGIHFPDLPGGTGGFYQVQRFLSDDSLSTQNVGATPLSTLINSQQRRMPVFISTRAALPVTDHQFATNTNGTEVERVAAVSRFTIEFDSPINPNLLGSPPYDPYITSQRDADEYDIHLPGKEGFSDRPGFLPLETGALSFLDDNGFPWVIELPSDWRWPTESREVWLGYPTFTSWVNSAGALNPSWYGSPVTAGSLVALPPAEYARTQSFTIGTP